jgi:hypothetical protein
MLDWRPIFLAMIPAQIFPKFPLGQEKINFLFSFLRLCKQIKILGQPACNIDRICRGQVLCFKLSSKMLFLTMSWQSSKRHPLQVLLYFVPSSQLR